MLKMDPKWAPMLGPFFAILPLFAVQGTLGSQNGSQGLPQEPSGPVQASIFTDFGWIFDRLFDDFWCHVGYFLLVYQIMFSLPRALLFQNSGHKFKLVWGSSIG